MRKGWRLVFSPIRLAVALLMTLMSFASVRAAGPPNILFITIDDMSWELPGGGVAKGESWEQAAIRECREEAGIICQSLTPILKYHQGIDTTLSPAHIFKCTEFTVSDEFSNRETDERKWFPYAEALEMALDGRIEDSLTIVGLLAHDRIINRS